MATGSEEWLIPPATRYLGAWGEVNARLSVRAQINTYHAATIIAIATAYFAIQEDTKAAHFLDYRLIPSILMPTFSTIFVAWYIHNDRILGLLGAYCALLRKWTQSAMAMPYLHGSMG